MRKLFLGVIVLCGITGCNSVYLKPNTLDKTDVIYVDRGGNQLQHVIKNHLEKRGYNLTVGYKKTSIKPTYIASNDEASIISVSDVGRARYVIAIREQTPRFYPFWCPFNGFWWWRFNMSIADNKTGQEILGWAGRGCANSTMRKLDDILDKLEITDEQHKQNN